VDRNLEGVVEMMLDATQNYAMPLTEEGLFGWHAALFPTGHRGMRKITTVAQTVVLTFGMRRSLRL
jgi:hypothetical protein